MRKTAPKGIFERQPTSAEQGILALAIIGAFVLLQPVFQAIEEYFR